MSATASESAWFHTVRVPNAFVRVPSWTIEQVSVRLQHAGVPKDDVRTLNRQEVDGECLLYVTDDALMRMGIPTFGRRVKLLKAIHTLIVQYQQSGGAGGSASAAPSLSATGPVGPIGPSLSSSGSPMGSPNNSAPHSRSSSLASTLPGGSGGVGGSASSASASRLPPRPSSSVLHPTASSAGHARSSITNASPRTRNSIGPAAAAAKSNHLSASRRGPISASSSSAGGAGSTAANRRAPLHDDDYDDDDGHDHDDDDDADDDADENLDHDHDDDLDDGDDDGLSHRPTRSGGGGGVGLGANATTDSDSEVSSDAEMERVYHPPAHKLAGAGSAAAGAAKKPASAADPDDLFATDEATSASEFMAVKPWLGAIVAPTNQPKANPAAPDRALRLEWVHGYRAFDSRSNLVYNANGEVVYPVAGVCVVYNGKTKRQKHFFGHNDDVRCLAQHPTKPNLIATGQNASVVDGKNSACYAIVWDSTDFTKNWVLKLSPGDRAVRSIAFSGDGKYVATVSNDDNNTVKVWDWEKKTMVASAKGDNNPIYQIRGNHKDPREFVTVGKRHAVFWTFDGASGRLTGKRAQMGGTSLSFFAVAFSEKGYACLGAEDGGIYVFVGGKPAKVFPNVHKGKVLSIDWYPGGIVTGGADCVCNVLDKKMDVAKRFTFTNKVASVHVLDNDLLVGTQGAEVFEIKEWADTEVSGDSELEAITVGHSDGELWAVAVSTDGRTVFTAGEDNMLAVWDVVQHKLVRRAIISDKKGKSPKIKRASTTSTHPTNQCARAIAIHPNGKHVIIGCNNGEVAIFEAKTLNRLCSLDLNKYGKRNVTDQTGNWIQAIAYSPSGDTCAVGTHGSVVVLLDTRDGYKPKGVLKGSNSFITHIDWSEDGTHVQTNDGAYELLFYNVDENDLKGAAQNPNASALRDVRWATQTCVLGWPVQGVFEPGMDGTDVNSCMVNPSRTLIATGDDFGRVNLFRYPALKGHKSVAAHAHSSHVVNVCFTPDDRYVLSTGGHDLALMQWSMV